MEFPLFNDFRPAVEDKPSEEQQRRYAYIRDCQTRRGVEVCSVCSYYNDCGVVKAYLREFGARFPNGGQL